MMDRSFEDERRNMFEQIKSLLISKMLIIQKTIKGINILKELARVKEWNYDQFTQNQQNTTSPVADLKSNNKSHARERRGTIVSATSLKNINTFRTHNSWGNNLNSELNKIDNDTPKSPELNRLDSNSTMQHPIFGQKESKPIILSCSVGNIEKPILTNKSLQDQTQNVESNQSFSKDFIPDQQNRPSSFESRQQNQDQPSVESKGRSQTVYTKDRSQNLFSVVDDDYIMVMDNQTPSDYQAEHSKHSKLSQLSNSNQKAGKNGSRGRKHESEDGQDLKVQSMKKSRDPRFQTSKMVDANKQNSVVQQPSVGSFDGASKGMAEEILPIFGQVSQSRSSQSEESVGFGLNRNKNQDSSSKNDNNSDIHNVNRSGFKRDTKTQDNEMKNGYGSFGSVGSIKSSPKNSKKSRKSGVVEKFEADSDFDSNGSVELLMMKSTKSAKMHHNLTDLESRRYSRMGMRDK